MPLYRAELGTERASVILYKFRIEILPECLFPHCGKSVKIPQTSTKQALHTESHPAALAETDEQRQVFKDKAWLDSRIPLRRMRVAG